MKKTGLLAGAAVLGLTLTTSLSESAEYCITCAGPSEMYRCVIEGSPEGPGTDAREKLACVSKIATEGKHETCTASKAAPYPCPGLVTVVKAPGNLATPPALGETEATGEPAAPAEERAATPGADPAASAKKVPKTVEELANQTVESTKKGLKQAGNAVESTAEKAGEKIGDAGSAVGNAAKKTWNCLTSFFSDC